VTCGRRYLSFLCGGIAAIVCACGGSGEAAGTSRTGQQNPRANRPDSSPALDTSEAAPAAGDNENGGVDIFPAARLNDIEGALASGPRTTRTIGSHGRYWYVAARRVSDGVPEVHDEWVDITIVQAGRATLLSGGRVDGSHVTSPGEHRGGTIIGATSRPISTGDLLSIPAGVPHQYRVTPGDSVRYLTIKDDRR
jgi:hypothetical protein